MDFLRRIALVVCALAMAGTGTVSLAGPGSSLSLKVAEATVAQSLSDAPADDLYDVNGDGAVDVLDVQALLSLGEEAPAGESDRDELPPAIPASVDSTVVHSLVSDDVVTSGLWTAPAGLAVSGSLSAEAQYTSMRPSLFLRRHSATPHGPPSVFLL